jgi:Ca2+-transporting ATPase
VLGTTIAVATLAAGLYAQHAGRPWQSIMFLALCCAQLAVALALRPRGAGALANPALVLAVAANVVLALLGVWWHPLQALLRTDPLSLADLLPCLAVTALAWVVARMQRQGSVRPLRSGRWSLGARHFRRDDRGDRSRSRMDPGNHRSQRAVD